MSNYDFRSQAHVGWNCSTYFFSNNNINYLSAAITELLMSTGKIIKVADHVIGSVMSNIATNFRPSTGDIYSRYTIPTEEGRDNLRTMNEQVITLIVNTIRGEYDQEACNARLSVWTTVLGDFNHEGLRSHSKIKIKENDYMKGMFSMNY